MFRKIASILKKILIEFGNNFEMKENLGNNFKQIWKIKNKYRIV